MVERSVRADRRSELVLTSSSVQAVSSFWSGHNSSKPGWEQTVGNLLEGLLKWEVRLDDSAAVVPVGVVEKAEENMFMIDF